MTRIAAYAAVVVTAFAFAFLRPEADDTSLALRFANSLGFVALALLALQLLVPVPNRVTRAAFRPTLLVRLHGRLGFAALVAAVGHVVVLTLDDPDRLSLLNPYTAPGRARAALAALVTLAVLVIAATRRRRGRQTRRWRRLHVGLSACGLALALGHVAGVGGYLGLDALTATLVALVPLGALVLLYFWPEPATPTRVDSSA